MKAFDRVNWSFLGRILQKLNFPQLVINSVKTLYCNISSNVSINGFLGKTFYPSQGIRQGCPLSPLLYVLFSEALNATIISRTDIKGPDENGLIPLISQYADDTCIGAIGQQSIFGIFRALSLFQNASGAKINTSKSNGLWLGANRSREDQPQSCNLSNKSLNVLGIPIATEFPPNHFWSSLLEKTQRQTNFYSKLNLLFKGRILVIKQLLIPVFLYPSTTILCPKNVIYELQKICNNFFWGDKSPRIPYHILELPVNLGGLRYPCIDRFFEAIRLTWTRDLFSTEADGTWKVMAEKILSMYNDRPFLGKNIFRLPLFECRISNSSLPYFYKKLLKSWNRFGAPENRPLPRQAANIRHEPLFNNPFITDSNGKPNPRPTWHKSCPHAVNTVQDLVYTVVPGFMPPESVIEEQNLNVKPKTISKLQNSLPKVWKVSLSKPDSPEPELFCIFDHEQTSRQIDQISNSMWYNLLKPPSLKSAHAEQASRKTPLYPHWVTKIGPVKWSKIFANLYSNHSDRKAVDIIYTLIHSGTPNLAKTHKFQNNVDPTCPRCGNSTETLEHIFFKCTHTIEIWEFAVRFLNRLHPQTKFSLCRFIIAGSTGWKNISETTEDIRLALVSTIWLNRNLKVHQNSNFDTLGHFRRTLRELLEIRASQNLKANKAPNYQFETLAEVLKHRVYFNLI